MHHRVTLESGQSYIVREYATTTATSMHYQAKENAVFQVLRAAGLATPRVLATTADARGPATLLSDDGGEPLETLFRELSERARPGFWREVGTVLRRLHAVDVDRAGFLASPAYQRPWMQFVPYAIKAVKKVVTTRPDLREAVDDFVALGPRLEDHLETRPKAISYGSAGYLPGMMLDRARGAWTVRSWLSLGYYVSITDPARDVVLIETSHREWTGVDLPSAFYQAYGTRPDSVSALLYGIDIQVSRGASYLRHHGKTGGKAGWYPPPHSTAIASLDEFPHAVAKLHALVAQPRRPPSTC